jgi:hypothetical protein
VISVMAHIKAVVNQCGVAMELHEHTPEPIIIDLISMSQLGAYRNELAQSNPDYRHATIGQLAVMLANRMFQNVTVSQAAWTYNASTNEYSRG